MIIAETSKKRKITTRTNIDTGVEEDEKLFKRRICNVYAQKARLRLEGVCNFK